MIRPAWVAPGLALVLALAACGVDGPPTRPSASPTERPEDRPEPGLQVSGEARLGVVSTL